MPIPFPHPTALRVGILVCGLVSALPACSGGAGGWSPDHPFRHTTGGQVLLEVRNSLEEEVTVRLRSSSVQKEIGRIPPLSTMHLAFPWETFGRVTFQLEPVSGSRYSFPALELRPGDQLELTVERPLERSRIRR